MKTYRELRQELNQCVRKQMGKALFAFFLLSMLQTVILSFFMAPVLLTVGTEKAKPAELAGAAVLLYLGFAFILVLQYGYHVLLARLFRGEYVTIGYLFNGFRERNRVVPAALLYAAGLLLALVICQIAAFFFNSKLEKLFDAFGLPALVLCILIAFAVLSLLLLVRFTFVWLCLYDNPSIRVSAAFKKSAGLLRHHSFRFIGFVLYSGGRWLIAAVVLFIVSLAVPASKNGTEAFLLFLLEFVYFVAAYSAMVRMFLSLPVFYDALTGGPTAIGGPEAAHPGELPPPETKR